MPDRNRDSAPDSPPAEVRDRSGTTDLEQVVEDSTSVIPPEDDAADDAVDGPAKRTPLEPSGVPDGNAGTGGVTKNQDDGAQ